MVRFILVSILRPYSASSYKLLSLCETSAFQGSREKDCECVCVSGRKLAGLPGSFRCGGLGVRGRTCHKKGGFVGGPRQESAS